MFDSWLLKNSIVHTCVTKKGPENWSWLELYDSISSHLSMGSWSLWSHLVTLNENYSFNQQALNNAAGHKISNWKIQLNALQRCLVGNEHASGSRRRSRVLLFLVNEWHLIAPVVQRAHAALAHHARAHAARAPGGLCTGGRAGT